MRIILAALGIAILPPFGDSSLVGGEEEHGRNLANACERNCELDTCTDWAEEEMFRSAQDVAKGKWNWCVGQNGNFDKKAKLGVCGEYLVEKPKYDCEEFASCVEDNHCSYYRKGRNVCTSSESVLKADWALDMCKSQQYVKANQWAGPCPISSFPYKEMEYDCKKFEECVEKHHCSQYSNRNCGIRESRSKAEWARSTCDDGQFKAANWWTDDCDIKNFKVESKSEECGDYYDCMLEANYDDMVESKSDILVDQCVENRVYRSTCRDQCRQGCDNDPCKHGSCTNKSGGKYTCTCFPGYEGKNCETNTNDCRFSPCGDHGTCYDKVNDYYCKCDDGWEGKQCSQMANMCKPSNPCKNGGDCKNLGNGKYSCNCKPGFSGKTCQLNTNECASQPCKNGATCIDKVNDFECKCKPGHSGKRCERDCVQCSNNPTKWMKENGKTCDDWPQGIPSKCKDTWWLNNQWCEEACAKAGAPYPDSYRCCGVDYDNRVPSQCSNLSVDQAQVCLFSKKRSTQSCEGCCQYMCKQLGNPCDDCVEECIGDNADCCQLWKNECGIGGKPCPDGECCSKYGFCGKTNAYCGQCCQGDQCLRNIGFSLDFDYSVDPDSSEDPESSDDPMPVRWDKFDAACRLADGSNGDRKDGDFDQYDDWDFDDCRKECEDRAKCEAFEYRFSRRECELWWVYPWKESHKSDYACWKKD
mmetsp:Transcript_14973/g.32617  ORF Transcript_14973/g.32617 Transcript_14973/m.32617 type:complete len:699 (+) Transcript_14973:166-2262(+)